MFDVIKSNSNLVKPSILLEGKKKEQANGHTSSKKKNKESNEFTSESNQIATTLGPGINLSSTPITLDLDPLLTGMTPKLETRLYPLYRDMYYYDSVSGAIADIFSTAPFSEFSLGGLADPAIERTFLESIERLNTRTLLPEIALDYLVLGAHCSSLLYNKEKRVFADLMPHMMENVTINELPFVSQDPILEVRFPKTVIDAISKSSERVKQLEELVGISVLDKIRQGQLELDPISTIYLPRKSFSTSKVGTSFFKRILPIWLIEKNLFRGTMMESARRQRGILHITLGDGDEWVPTAADMEYFVDLFAGADIDPLGAIIATRMGVTSEEIRCLAGDSLIQTPNGSYRLDKVVKHDPKDLKENTTVPVSIMVLGVEGKFVEVDQWHYRGYKPVFKYTLESNISITCTENHRFPVLTPDGTFIYKKISEVSGTDKLCVKLQNNQSITSFTPNYSGWAKAFLNGYRFEKVVNVEDLGRQHVYDLSVKQINDEHCPIYIANGIATHNSPQDFWKVTEYQDSVMQYKLRALGVPESLLSGDLPITATDNNMSVFLDRLKTFRDTITRKIFYDKIFPIISMVNGYTVNAKGRVVISDRLKTINSIPEAMKVLNDGSRLLIPTICYAKHIKPAGDQPYLELLNTLSEKGIPAPVRILSAAGGVNIDELLKQQEDDLALRKRLAEYNKKVAEFAPKPPEGGEGEMGMSESADRLLASTSSNSAVLGNNKRVPLLERQYPEVTGRTKTGKRKSVSITEAKNKEFRANKIWAKALAQASKRED